MPRFDPLWTEFRVLLEASVELSCEGGIEVTREIVQKYIDGEDLRVGPLNLRIKTFQLVQLLGDSSEP